MKSEFENKMDIYYHRYFSECERILDAGCGIGNFISNSPEKITGIDKNLKNLATAKKHNFNVMFMDLDKKLRFKDNYFDGIFCSQTIDYLKNPVSTLKEFRRILKKEGKLFIKTSDNTKHKTYSMKALENFAKKSGFEILSSDYDYIPVREFNELTKVHPRVVLFFQDIIHATGFKNKNHIILLARK